MKIRPKKSDQFQHLHHLLCFFMFGGMIALLPWLPQKENPESVWERVAVVGAVDAIAFWAGSQAMLGGGNPYDQSVIFEIERAAQPWRVAPQPFLNPPWALPLLFVFNTFGFDMSRLLWLFCNLFFIVGASFFFSHQYANCSEEVGELPLLVAYIFLPLFHCVWIGQLSLLLTCSLAAALWSISRNRDILAGLLLLPLTMKPHLFLPLAVALLVWMIKERRFNPLVSGTLGFISCCIVTLAIRPIVFSDWLALDFDPRIFRTATLAGGIREWVYFNYGDQVHWPLIAFPLLGIVGTFFALIRQKSFDLFRLFSPL
ncbi:MAG: DUF2029 domain-containing protein, partial [Bdellovibrionales bacterium]|nr:DUF2029 domain-containing protein [Bdellovibrionales bacterium]